MKKLVLSFISISIFSLQAIAIDCHGTEPFWSATVTGSEVSLQDVVMGGNPKVFNINSTTGAAGFVADYIQIFSNNNGPVAVVKQATCNNGMSDLEFPQEVILFTETNTLYGCCGTGVEPVEP